MPKSPFAEVAPALYKKGYSIIPLKPESKIPMFNNWNQYCETWASKELLNEWYKLEDANIGVCTGKASGIIALDFDEDVDGLHKQIEDITELTFDAENPLKKGSRGYTAFFRYNGEINKTFKKNGKVVLEILSTGRHTVLPPSKHPKGGEYHYCSFNRLDDSSPTNLRFLPEDALFKIEALFKKEGDKNNKSKSFNTEDLKEAMKFIPNSREGVDYDTWIQVGMALKDALGDEGFQVWETWSEQSDKYDSESSHFKWNSFKNGKGVSVATIFYLAMENGFEFKNPVSLDGIIDPKSLEQELEDWRVNGLDQGLVANMGELDDLIHFRKGEFSLWTGYANAGKSEFIDSIAINLMKQEWRFLYCSMEKKPSRHLQSLIHKYTSKSITERSKEEQKEALNFYQEYLSLIKRSSETNNLSIDGIYKIAKLYKRIKGLDALVIDPFNYIPTEEESLHDHVKYVTIRCADMAKELDIHVFLVAHPKVPDKSFGDKLPKLTMYSISGGAHFANTADIIASVNREKGITRVNVVKVRDQDIDRLGTAFFQFDNETKQHIPCDAFEF